MPNRPTFYGVPFINIFKKRHVLVLQAYNNKTFAYVLMLRLKQMTNNNNGRLQTVIYHT